MVLPYPHRCSTLAGLLLSRAEGPNGGKGFIRFADLPEKEESFSYMQLARHAAGVAARLQMLRSEGERALLLYKSASDFLPAFFGCLFAKVIAVPVGPSAIKVDGGRTQSLEGVLVDAKPSIVLTCRRFESALRNHPALMQLSQVLSWIITDDDDIISGGTWHTKPINETDVAYLQYTSGSTSDPKGVIISHANVLDNLAFIDRGFRHSSDSVAVSWLPHFHDMGLVYGLMQPLYNEFDCILLTPESFISQPARWLNAISRHRATHSGGPNFAYDLCVRKITPAQRQRFDLSSWSIAFNGAEPIRPDTLRSFTEAFGPYGFRFNAFYPAYGLAEATLKVTGPVHGHEPLVCTFAQDLLERKRVQEVQQDAKTCRALVGCGSASPTTTIRIVNTESFQQCGPHEIGEIWIAGPSVALGYWNRPSETRDMFGARIDGTEGFLRTGDLGFFHRGQLFITGRLKDLIIIRGFNHYPQDIEGTVSRCHERLTSGSCAVFSVSPVEEELVVVQEVTRTIDGNEGQSIVSSIRAAVAKEHGLKVHIVVLAKLGSIPKTSSGKVRRNSCRQMFFAGALATVFCSADVVRLDGVSNEETNVVSPIPTAAGRVREDASTLSFLLEEVAHLLRVRKGEVDSDMSLVKCGFDSLMIAELQHAILRATGVDVPIIVLLAPSVSLLELAEYVNRSSRDNSSAEITDGGGRGHPGYIQEKHSLSLEQERLWILSQLESAHPTYNIGVQIEIAGETDFTVLTLCIQEIIQRHESLRLRFAVVAGQPVQELSSTVSHGLSLVDLSGSPEPSRGELAMGVARQQAAAPFNLIGEPLFRCACIHLGNSVHRLIIVIHHIISDLHSIRLITTDLAELYDYFAGHRDGTRLDQPSHTYHHIASLQRKLISAGGLKAEQVYWTKKLRNTSPGHYLQPDRPLVTAYAGVARHAKIEVPRDVLAGLRTISKNEGVTQFVTLLAAMKVLLCVWSGHEDIVVASPSLGRSYLGTECIVGLFAFPMLLRTIVSPASTFRHVIQGVRQTVLEAQANQRLPLSKILEVVNLRRSASGRPFCQVMFAVNRPPEPVFNRTGITFTPSQVSSGFTDIDLCVTMTQSEHELTGDLIFRGDRFDDTTACRLSEAYVDVLRRCAENPETRVRELSMHRSGSERYENMPTLAIAATFVADPIRDSLQFWFTQLDLAFNLSFVPYNQVWQELLGVGTRHLAENRNGVNVLLIRLEDWLAKSSTNPFADVAQTVEQFVTSLKARVQTSAVPYVLILCPSSQRAWLQSDQRSMLLDMERMVQAGLANVMGVCVTTSTEIAATYPVEHYYDHFMDDAFSIPYTPKMFTVLGTCVARRINTLLNAPYKVIVLDCDGTLWKGTCAEEDVRLDPPYTVFQEFMLRQHGAGMLLCLCSKNGEEDVVNTFNNHSEMPLKLEHFVGSRINWRSKSVNIKDLARQLRIATDSIIFIDDDIVECAEVQANCPDVLTLQFPADPKDVPMWLNHVWAFDQSHMSPQARVRSSFYKNDPEREAVRARAISIEDFINGLMLEVDISSLQEAEIPRAAELTRRTNQMNFTSVRRADTELQRIRQFGDHVCMGVHVRDRFDNYGLVGLIISVITPKALTVDTFLLSCRALGRAVEHRMLAAIGESARLRGITQVVVPFVFTARNEPALKFLTSLGQGSRSHAEGEWTFEFAVDKIDQALQRSRAAQVTNAGAQ